MMSGAEFSHLCHSCDTTSTVYSARRFNVPLDAFPTLLRADANAAKLDAFVRAHPDNQRVQQEPVQ